MKLPLPWKWFGALALLLVGLQLVINLCIDAYLPPFLRQTIRVDLERVAELVRENVTGRVDLNEQAHQLGHRMGLRLTLISSNGTVLAESDKPTDELATLENHLQRPEVQQALRDGVGSATRHSATIGVDFMYVAVRNPTGDDPSQPAIVRVAMPLTQIRATVRHVQRIVALASVVATLAAFPMVFWLSRRTSQPILHMREVARQITAGDFSHQAPHAAPGELGDLATALNEMAAQLQTRLRELADEKAELNATLTNMIEGVLVVDATGKIRLANRALQQMLAVSELIVGHTVTEAFRNPALAETVAQALASEQATTGELVFLGSVERVFDINAARLRDQEGRCTGVVIVFHDITRIKHLENLRKEFVANVSHELRTPLSIIKGYVETLLEQPPPDAATARQFLQTIDKHAQRLESLIADLLSISALESQQSKPGFGPVPLRPSAENARQELARAAAAKAIVVTIAIPDELPPARADAGRLHQVFVNLLENAIKYTQAGGAVTVTAERRDDALQVCVADNGPGIAAEHLPRIFERFYRVDKARSRELGGTGLGLSIVKHIVQSHNGKVWAESVEQGSRFYFTLPLA